MSHPHMPWTGICLPPHANAEVHKRIMEKLARMSADEIFETAVRAGIYTPDGRLTEHYAEEPDSPAPQR
jgi:hypothetical protein